MNASSITKRISSGRAWLVVAVLAAFALGFVLRGGGGEAADDAGEAATSTPEQAGAEIWTCSMHPQIQLPEPGKCPICFMDLIPLEDSGGDELGPRTLEMSEAAAALAEIQSIPVERRAVAAAVRLLGQVDYDETRYRTITAWVGGRIDTLFVDYTGTTVRRGEKLVSLYSPDLYAAQTELFNAMEAQQELKASENAVIRRTAEATVKAARERLRLWGLTTEQIASIERRGEPSYHLAIRSPLAGVVVHKNAVEGMYVDTGTRIYTVADLSHVWVTLDAYESDLIWLAEGQKIDFTVEALPGRDFTGTIVFIDPVLDQRTRTVTVRLDVANADRLLKPGMFVSAVVDASVATGGETPLVIPATAPLITGKRAVVYVRVPGREKPTFEGRVVELGPRAGDWYVVESGLAEGERVVVKGNFKIDSALQIQAKPSMMNPEGGAPPAGHDHGDARSMSAMTATATASVDDPAAMPTYAAPDGFQEQLGAVLAAYLEMQKALAADDDPGARAAAAKTEDALSGVDMGLLSGDAHMAWMQDLDELGDTLQRLQAADGIDARREAFLPFSEALWYTLRRFRYHGHETVRLFHCPMAFDNEGGDWIQTATTTANPYYGSAMLRCGSQTDSIAGMHAHQGGE